jgi:hypothetical protein
VLVDRQGHGPLDQPLDPGRDGGLLGQSTGHSEDPNPPPRRPSAPSRSAQLGCAAVGWRGW